MKRRKRSPKSPKPSRKIVKKPAPRKVVRKEKKQLPKRPAKKSPNRVIKKRTPTKKIKAPEYKDFLPKPKKTFNYEKAQRKLQAFGIETKIGSGRGREKAKTLWREYAGYINHTKKPRAVLVGTRKAPVHEREKHRFPSLKPKLYNFKFQKLTDKQRKAAQDSGLFSKRQFTPKGIFVEKPINIDDKDFKITFEKGRVQIQGGSRSDVMTKLNTKNLLENPQKEVARAIKAASRKGKKPKAFSLVVNGYRSSHSSQSIKSFSWYIANKLLPQWTDKNEDLDDEERGENFSDQFHLRIVY